MHISNLSNISILDPFFPLFTEGVMIENSKYERVPFFNSSANFMHFNANSRHFLVFLLWVLSKVLFNRMAKMAIDIVLEED